MRAGIRIERAEGIPDAMGRPGGAGGRGNPAGEILLWPLALIQPPPSPDHGDAPGAEGAPGFAAVDPVSLTRLARGGGLPLASLARRLVPGAEPGRLQVALVGLVTPAQISLDQGRRLRDDLLADLQRLLGRERSAASDPVASLFLLLSGDLAGARLGATSPTPPGPSQGSSGGAPQATHEEADTPGAPHVVDAVKALRPWAGKAVHLELRAARTGGGEGADLLAGRAELLRRIAPNDGPGGPGGMDLLGALLGQGSQGLVALLQGGGAGGSFGGAPGVGGEGGGGTTGGAASEGTGPHPREEAALEEAAKLSLSGLGLLPSGAFEAVMEKETSAGGKTAPLGVARRLEVPLRGEPGARGTGKLVASVTLAPDLRGRPALAFEGGLGGGSAGQGSKGQGAGGQGSGAGEAPAKGAPPTSPLRLLVAAGTEWGDRVWFEIGGTHERKPGLLGTGEPHAADPESGASTPDLSPDPSPVLLLPGHEGFPVVGGWRENGKARLVRFGPPNEEAKGSGSGGDTGDRALVHMELPEHPRLHGPLALAAAPDGRLGVAGVEEGGRIVLLLETREGGGGGGSAPPPGGGPVQPPVTPPVPPPVQPPVTPPVQPPVTPPGRPPVTPPVTPPAPPTGRPPVVPPVTPPVTPPMTPPGRPPVTPPVMPPITPPIRPPGGLPTFGLDPVSAPAGRGGEEDTQAGAPGTPRPEGGRSMLEGALSGRLGKILDPGLLSSRLGERLAGGLGTVRANRPPDPGSGRWTVASPDLAAPGAPPTTLALALLGGEKEVHPWIFHAAEAHGEGDPGAPPPTGPNSLHLDRRVGGRWSRTEVALERLGPVDVAGGFAVKALPIRTEGGAGGGIDGRVQGTVLLLAAVDAKGQLTLATAQVAAAGDAPGDPGTPLTWRRVPLGEVEGQLPAGLSAPSLALTPEGTGAAIALRGPTGDLLLLTTGTATPFENPPRPGGPTAPPALHLDTIPRGGIHPPGPPRVTLTPVPPTPSDPSRVVHPSRALPIVAWTDAEGALHLARRSGEGTWYQEARHLGDLLDPEDPR